MQAELKYNWDDIEVGRFDLNHSENFFTQKHCKHEKFSEEFYLIRAMAATNHNESFSNNIAIENHENKENSKPIVNQPEKQSIEVESKTGKVDLVSGSHLTISSNNRRPENLVLRPKTPQPTNSQSNKQTIVPAAKNEITPTNNCRPANLLTRPKTPQLQAKLNSEAASSAIGKNGKAKVDPPHAYDFQEIYQKKKEETMRKLLEEEKKNRIFHSRPVPKSVAAPRPALARKEFSGQITAAKTPVVLKNSREADERRKQRLAEWKKKNAPIKFTSREAAVLQEEPFRPKKSGQTVQMQPFNLHVERRLEERKQYDEQFKRTAEEKKKQEEEERKKREEELVKELRKLASFKARPNPFK